MITQSPILSYFEQYIPEASKLKIVKILEKCQKAEIRFKSLNAKEHSNPIFILGNQKSGTSAIATLLSKLTGESASVDLMYEYLDSGSIYKRVYKDRHLFNEIIKRNRFDFSKRIIKEANLTPFYVELRKHFPNAKFVFIVRNPKDNIRSIFNRLNLPGNMADLTPELKNSIPDSWNIVMDGSWFGYRCNSYVQIMAERWRFLTDLFFEHQNQMILIRYEDFLKDKIGVIRHLAKKLSLTDNYDISNMIDIQYQPGGNRNVDLKLFFGSNNINKIEECCKINMNRLNYC